MSDGPKQDRIGTLGAERDALVARFAEVGVQVPQALGIEGGIWPLAMKFDVLKDMILAEIGKTEEDFQIALLERMNNTLSEMAEVAIPQIREQQSLARQQMLKAGLPIIGPNGRIIPPQGHHETP